jgi:putative transposase
MMSLPEREQVMRLLNEATAAGARRKQACAVMGLSLRTLQRRQADETIGCDRRTTRSFEPANKLTEEERRQLLMVANSADFGHLPPSQIVPRLADRGEYIASESTFYRVLREENQRQHRRSERPAQPRHKPLALSATAPNQLYSWDITYLPTLIRGVFLYLYLFIDLYSRKIVGWQIYEEESSAWASDLIRDICQREGIPRDQVVLHSDNGSPMKGATMLATLQSLGIMPSFSRPAVSNDNPYSEALFKTLKYRPDYPEKPFEGINAARRWVTEFVQWYNHEHQHSAIRFVTPAERHAGLDTTILSQRTTVYEVAKARCPQRWTTTTRNWQPILIVHLNPQPEKETKMAA